MRIITWNVRRAMKNSPVWEFLLAIQPDIALLQEVGSMPEEINAAFEVKSMKATNKSGKHQNFSTAVLVKGKIINDLHLSSKYGWVNKELDFFKGNFIGCTVQLQNKETMNVVSVYSPAWPVDKKRYLTHL